MEFVIIIRFLIKFVNLILGIVKGNILVLVTNKKKIVKNNKELIFL